MTRQFGHTILPHRVLTDEQIAIILVYKHGWMITPRAVKQIAAKAERMLRTDPRLRQLAFEFNMDPDAPEDETETWACVDCDETFPHDGFYWDCYGNRTSRCRTCHRAIANKKKWDE